ncbi:hypothetical protein [Geminocystis sp.]|uniref:hypothetical protein n=1 Tax=Geminocystis sp. TaxID=2664100 RepID=UPI0035947556
MNRLKRWESPRREGRNQKGKGGNAKKKQWQKRLKMLRNKLKNNNSKGGEVNNLSSFFMTYFYPSKLQIKALISGT